MLSRHPSLCCSLTYFPVGRIERLGDATMLHPFPWPPAARGGFGVYYNFLPVFIGFRQLGFNNPPYLLAETFDGAAGLTPTLTLAQPFGSAGAISPNPSITAVQRNIRNSESYQWNFTL